MQLVATTFTAALLAAAPRSEAHAAVSLAARAAAPAEPEAAEAQRRLEEGNALFEQQKYEAARVKYTQACAVLRTDNCVRGLAFMEFYSGHFRESYAHFREALNGPNAPGLDAPTVAMMRESMAKAAARIGLLYVDAPPSDLVLLDGKDMGRAEQPVPVAPGRHVVEVTGRARRLVELAPGGSAHVSFASEKPDTGSGAPRDGAEGGAARYAVSGSMLALGAAAFVGGIVLKLEADRMQGRIERTFECVRPCGDLEGQTASANSSATWSHVLYGGGAVLAAGSIATFLLWPRPKAGEARQAITPLLGPTVRGASYTVQF